MVVTTDLIKKLRNETKVGLMDVKKALEENNGDMEKAKQWLREKGLSRAAKKADRETGEGAVVAYIHSGNKVGALVKINCETDFVARNDELINLAREIGMQVASMNPADVKELLAQSYIRDAKMTIEELIKITIAKLGENIVVAEFSRLEI